MSTLFLGFRIIECIDSFGDDLGTSSKIIETTSLLKCIVKINKQRKYDILNKLCEKEFMNACCGGTICYRIIIYTDKRTVISKTIDMYEDYYIENDDDEIAIQTTTKTIYANLHKIYKNNIIKCINNCLLSDKKK